MLCVCMICDEGFSISMKSVYYESCDVMLWSGCEYAACVCGMCAFGYKVDVFECDGHVEGMGAVVTMPM